MTGIEPNLTNTTAPFYARLRDGIRRFKADTSGAVTVDWVVMTAAVVGLAMVVMVSVGSAVETSADKVDRCIGRIGTQTFKQDKTMKAKTRSAMRQCDRL